jgi:hypothetical protein
MPLDPSEETFDPALRQQIPIWEPLSLCQALLLQEVYLWRLALYKNFLAEYLAPYPPPQTTAKN